MWMITLGVLSPLRPAATGTVREEQQRFISCEEDGVAACDQRLKLLSKRDKEGAKRRLVCLYLLLSGLLVSL